jgi:hypothetical protein
LEISGLISFDRDLERIRLFAVNHHGHLHFATPG